MAAGIINMAPDRRSTVAAAVGNDRVSGAETVCGSKPTSAANEGHDRFFVDHASGVTITGGAARAQGVRRDDPEALDHASTSRQRDAASVTLADRTTITFVGVANLAADQFVATDDLYKK